MREIFRSTAQSWILASTASLNARAGEINDYLQNRLAEKVQAALSRHSGSNTQYEQVARTQRKRSPVSRPMAQPGKLVPKVQELYAESPAQYDIGASEHENAVFSPADVFLPLPKQGDFISQRRYKGDCPTPSPARAKR